MMKVRGTARISRITPIASGVGLIEQLEPRQMLDAAWPEGYGTVFSENGGGKSCTVDLDNDGDLDLVVWRRPELRILFNDGSGEFAEAGRVRINGTPTMLAAGDVNGDGFEDIVALGNLGGHRVLHVYVNDQTGMLERLSRQPTRAEWVGCVDAPVDGEPDRIVLRRPRELWLGEVVGERVARARTLVLSLGTITNPAPADFDADGRADALVVGVTDRDAASLLEVQLDAAGDPARTVFSRVGATIYSVVTRRPGAPERDGPSVAFNVVTFTDATHYQNEVLTTHLPAELGLEYAEPIQWFVDEGSVYEAGGPPARSVGLRLIAIEDVDDDGAVEVVTVLSTSSYEPHFGVSGQYSALLTINWDSGPTWTAYTRDEGSAAGSAYDVVDLNGDGLPDVIRARRGGHSAPHQVQVAFNMLLP